MYRICSKLLKRIKYNNIIDIYILYFKNIDYICIRINKIINNYGR